MRAVIADTTEVAVEDDLPNHVAPRAEPAVEHRRANRCVVALVPLLCRASAQEDFRVRVGDAELAPKRRSRPVDGCVVVAVDRVPIGFATRRGEELLALF